MSERISVAVEEYRAKVWPQHCRAKVQPEAFIRAVSRIAEAGLGGVVATCQPANSGYGSTVMRSHSLQPHGASVAWETLESCWMSKQAIWAVKPSSKFVQRAADRGVPVFADVLDVYHTADARDPWLTQLFGYRNHPLVTWVGTTPSAVRALMTLGNTILVPHQGDRRVKPRVFVPTAAPIYWGANEYFQPWMDEVTRVFGTYVLEKGPNYNPCGPMLNLRGGRWATRANAKLKPQVKLANAILADVPLISTDLEAGQSLAELWNIPYIQVTSLQEAKDRIEEVPLILLKGGS